MADAWYYALKGRAGPVSLAMLLRQDTSVDYCPSCETRTGKHYIPTKAAHYSTTVDMQTRF